MNNDIVKTALAIKLRHTFFLYPTLSWHLSVNSLLCPLAFGWPATARSNESEAQKMNEYALCNSG